MDGGRFDHLTRIMADGTPLSRRRTLGGVIGGLWTVAVAAAGRAEDAAAARDGERDGPSSQGCARAKKACGAGKKCCGGLACKGGRCRCKGETKACKGRCIPQGECCSAADCGGKACLDGVCQPCAAGFKVCFLSCIPEEECCLCSGGKVCQGGACVCPGGTTECNGVCCRGAERCLFGRCAIPCDSFRDCPSGCQCSAFLGGEIVCRAGSLGNCQALPTCTNSNQCATGEVCDRCDNNTTHCVPLCRA